MSSDSPKRMLFDSFAETAKALGHGRRLEILELAAQGEPGVETIAARAGLSVANASQHLQQLRRAGLLAARRDGKHIRYRLSDPAVLDLLSALRRVAERNVSDVRAVVDGYFAARDSLEPVGRKELARRIRDRVVTVLDVRPPDEFAAGHVAKAVNIPLGELARRLRELPKDREIVAYCRGPYCVLAFEAVALLRKRGLAARRLEDGFPEWKAAGLPVE